MSLTKMLSRNIRIVKYRKSLNQLSKRKLQLQNDLSKEESLKQEYYSFARTALDWNSTFTYIGLASPMLLCGCLVVQALTLYSSRLERQNMEAEQISQSLTKKDNSLKIEDL